MGSRCVGSRLRRAVVAVAASLFLGALTANAAIVPSPNLNANALASALTSSGGTGITITSASLSGSGLGTYQVTGPSPDTYGLQPGSGIVLSTGSVASVATAADTTPCVGATPCVSTDFGQTATPAQQALLGPIAANHSTFDVSQLNVTFSAGPSTNTVFFQVVFMSDEYPQYTAQIADAFGLFFNNTNIAFVGGLPVNIQHPGMAALAGTQFNGVLRSSAGLPILTFSAPVVPGSTGNTLTFIIGDTNDNIIDTAVLVSALGGTPPTTLSVDSFAAQCQFGLCSFPVGSTITFSESFSGGPTSYEYDWNGDGIFEQSSGAPVTSHTYTSAGTFQPKIRVHRGSQTAERTHDTPIQITAGGQAAVGGPASLLENQAGQFQASVVGCSPSGWSWSAPGGAVSPAGDAATVIWPQAGSYTVTATTTGGCAGASGSKAVTVQAVAPPVVAPPAAVSASGSSPKVATGLTGVRVTTWVEGDRLYLRRFDSAGAPIGNKALVGFVVAGSQPVVATAPNGAFTVVWEGGGASAAATAAAGKSFGGLWGRGFDPTATPTNTPTQIDPAGTQPTAARNSQGRTVVAWAVPGGLKARSLNSAGNPAGATQLVDSSGGADPRVVVGRTDDFILAYRRVAQNKSGSSTYWGRGFDPQGTPSSGEQGLGGPSQGEGTPPDVAADPAGEPVVVYGDSRGVRGSKRSGGGRQEQTIASSLTGGQAPRKVAVAGNAFGDLVIGWEEPGKVGVKTLDPSLNATSQPQAIGDAAGGVAVALDASGKATVAYESTSGGVSSRAVQATTAATCAGGGTLCTLSNRFTIDVTWRTSAGTTGVGSAVPLTDQAGYFWFFGAENVELIIKVIDGRLVNNHFWVYYGALSDQAYTVVVTDRVTGNAAVYVNQQGHLGSVADPNALPASASTIAAYPVKQTETLSAPGDLLDGLFDGFAVALPAAEASGPNAKATCVPSAQTLCLLNNRFALQMSWHIPDGTTGVGHAVALPGNQTTGYFWFFDPQNAEVVVKVLDARVVNGKFWVYYGALSDVQYDLTITDRQTSHVKVYHNTQGNAASFADTSAFSDQ